MCAASEDDFFFVCAARVRRCTLPVLSIVDFEADGGEQNFYGWAREDSANGRRWGISVRRACSSLSQTEVRLEPGERRLDLRILKGCASCDRRCALNGTGGASRHGYERIAGKYEGNYESCGARLRTVGPALRRRRGRGSASVEGRGWNF